MNTNAVRFLIGYLHGFSIRRARELCRILLGKNYKKSIYGVNIVLDLDNIVDQHLLWGEWEPHVCNFLRQNLKRGDHVIEVGANVGAHSLLIAELIGPEGVLYAFEPDDYGYNALSTRINTNDIKNIILKKTGVGDGTRDLEAISQLGVRTRGASMFLRRESLVALDDLAAESTYLRPKLLKIDVDGGDLSVLRSASGLLHNYRPDIIIEFCPVLLEKFCERPNDVFRILREFGYRGYDLVKCDELDYISAMSRVRPGSHIDLLFSLRDKPL